MNDDQLYAVQLLEQVENATADLYAAYAGCMPLYERFWNRLAADERLHAHWVQGLVERVRQGDITFRENRFDEIHFQEFLTYLQRRLEEVIVHPISMSAALAIAKDVEGTMLERLFFEVFESDNPALRQVLHNLHSSTEAHAHAITRLWLLMRSEPRQAKASV